MEWIKVTEMLPNENEEVIVTVDNNVNEVLTCVGYQNGKWVCLDSEYYGMQINCKVIAWMPLPKPYREE